MVILGLDPGIATTGFGLIKYDGYKSYLLTFGCIKTLPGSSLGERIKQIIDDLKTLLEEFKPDEISIEEIYFNKNVKTGIQVAQARGAILYQLVNNGYKPHEYNPMQIKSSIGGYGKAKKDQIQKMVQLILNLEEIPKPDDAADALAVALCHAHFIKLNTLST